MEKRVACAVCKCCEFPCNENCPFAPHFPADKNEEFMEVNKLYGLTKILDVINDQKNIPLQISTMETMKFEASQFYSRSNELSRRDGCLGLTLDLNATIINSLYELIRVRQCCLLQIEQDINHLTMADQLVGRIRDGIENDARQLHFHQELQQQLWLLKSYGGCSAGIKDEDTREKFWANFGNYWVELQEQEKEHRQKGQDVDGVVKPQIQIQESQVGGGSDWDQTHHEQQDHVGSTSGTKDDMQVDQTWLQQRDGGSPEDLSEPFFDSFNYTQKADLMDLEGFNLLLQQLEEK
ncbi:Lateral organ boundaries, LOB [Dillenia turbinata]|uniref:Lateral organ boundaries, LOB n=1 Tax=Dillenia turbinata TaxID=194707 RepID=A0AAN8V2J2_9MAGN